MLMMHGQGSSTKINVKQVLNNIGKVNNNGDYLDKSEISHTTMGLEVRTIDSVPRDFRLSIDSAQRVQVVPTQRTG